MRTACLVLLLVLLPGPAAATILCDGRAEEHALLGELEALLDPAGTFTVGEVATRHLDPLSAFDRGPGRWPWEPQPMVWLGFSFQVTTPETWDLVIGQPYQAGTLYIEASDGTFSQTPISPDASGGSFRARLPTGTHRAFLRIPGPLARPSILHLATAAGQEQLLGRFVMWQGLYVGVMLAMLLVNLLVGVLLRDRAQLWYVGFVASSIVTFALLTGAASRVVLPALSASALLRTQHVFLALTVLAGVQFSRVFLDSRRRAPRSDRLMRAFLWLAAAVLLAVCLAPDVLATRAVALLGLLVPLVALSAGMAAWRTGSPWARFYLVGWALFTVGGFLFAISVTGGLEVFQATSVLEAGLFTAAFADRMRSLQAQRARAEQALARSERLAALGHLVAGVAHEVNNPNNFLTFNLPILQEYLDATRPHVEAAGEVRLVGLPPGEFYQDASKLIGNMKHGAERISGIVSQLKSYARPVDDAQWETADVNPLVERAATLVRTQLRQWVETFELELGERLPRVRMHPGHIEQVVVNLLVNAGQAARTTAGARVVVSTRQVDGAVEIAVSDNGPGVPEPIRTRIFEPFFTTKAPEQGTGMGLAISQRIVEAHAGTLTLASADPGHTRFVIRLPVEHVP